MEVPVSYKHLDVYKRQMQENGLGIRNLPWPLISEQLKVRPKEKEAFSMRLSAMMSHISLMRKM